MAKRIESQRTEAYRIYMSDSLALSNKMMLGEEADIPRYIDMFKKEPEKEETPEQIISRFDKLRRREE